MKTLNLKVEGYSRNSINFGWETHELNGSLHSVFSGVIDGFVIEKIVIISVDTALQITKNGVPINVGEDILQSDMDSGNIIAIYDHSYGSASLLFEAIGQGKYTMRVNFNSNI